MAKVKKARSVVPRAPPLTFRPMPNMRVNLVFKQEKGLVESAAGVGVLNWYRINGAFDPDQSAGGPSAIGFNNYATLYLSYRVMACRVRVEGFVSFPAVGNLATVTLMPNSRNVTAPANADLWGGEYGAASTTVAALAAGGQNKVVLDQTYYPWKVARITKQQYVQDMDFASLVTGTPTREMYVALGVQGQLGGAIASLNAMVTVSYEVEFFDPVVLA